jgi:hypothetical protein
MTGVLGKVLSAFAASGTLVPSALLNDLLIAVVEIRSPKVEGVFMEDVVQLYVPHTSRTVAIRIERVVFAGLRARLAQYSAAHPIVQAVYGVPPASALLPEAPPGECPSP